MSSLINSKYVYIEKEKKYLNEFLSAKREETTKEFLFGQKEIRGRVFSNTEFNDEILDVQFEDCVFENCKFTGSKIQWVSFFECFLKNCSFTDEGLFMLNFVSSTLLHCDFSHKRDFQELLFDSSYIYSVTFNEINNLQLSVKDSLLDNITFLNSALRLNFRNSFLFSVNYINVKKIYFHLTESIMNLESIINFSFSGLFSEVNFLDGRTDIYCSEYKRKLLTDDFIKEWKKKTSLKLHIF
jgi:uncharacterized protein YjbI with pentapeptide repeats